MEDSIDNILKRIEPKYEPITTKYDNYKETVKLGLKADLVAMSNDPIKVEKLKKKIRDYKKPKEDFIKEMNTALPRLRKTIKQKYGKREFRKKDHMPEILDMFQKIFKERLKGRALNNIDWESFELLLFGWEVYLKEKSIDQSKCNPNDYEDLTNLGYVQRGMPYWTKDDKEPYRTLRKNKYAKEYFYNE